MTYDDYKLRSDRDDTPYINERPETCRHGCPASEHCPICDGPESDPVRERVRKSARWRIEAVDLAGNTWEVGATDDPYRALALLLERDHPSEQLRVVYDDEDGQAAEARIESTIEDAEERALAEVPEAWVG